MNIRDKVNLETSEHAFLGKTDFSDTVEIRWLGVYIEVSQTKHGIMQKKTSDYMPRVNTKLVNCSLNFVFVCLRPKSTAMVIAGRSVHLTTLFPGQA